MALCVGGEVCISCTISSTTTPRWRSWSSLSSSSWLSATVSPSVWLSMGVTIDNRNLWLWEVPVPHPVHGGSGSYGRVQCLCLKRWGILKIPELEGIMRDGELLECKICGGETPHTLSVYYREDGAKAFKVKVYKCELCLTEKSDTRHVLDVPVLC